MKAKKITRLYLMVFIGLVTGLSVTGQNKTAKYDLLSLLENDKFAPFNRQISPFSENGKRGISLSKNENDGIAWLKGVEFSNGTIEIDIRGKNVFQQSFVGIAFHGLDNETLDAVYFRPFNFQSTDLARKIHGVQYVSHPDNPWYVLREKQDGKYEKEVIPAPEGTVWFHAKIVVQYPHVAVYVNGSPEPSLSIDKLNNRETGKIGLWVGNNSDGDFANLQITSQD